jgi:DNA-binding response OmpR family regulator
LIPFASQTGRGYNSIVSTRPTLVPQKVGILVLDNDATGGTAVKQILDSEGWRVRIVPDIQLLLAELKTGEWSLVIANVALTGVQGPVFVTLRELASVSSDDGGRIRVLYLIPEMASAQYLASLEAARLPYVLRPYHLHDFLEKVSDLLVEVKAIEGPIRQVRHEFGALRKKKKQAGRSNSMFASRDSFSYSDEELAEYEKAESEASSSKRNKPRTNLGGSDR